MTNPTITASSEISDFREAEIARRAALEHMIACRTAKDAAITAWRAAEEDLERASARASHAISALGDALVANRERQPA